MLDPTAEEKRPRWVPQPARIGPDDVPSDRVAAAVGEDGVARQLLGKVSALQHYVATLLVRRELTARGLLVDLRVHSSGLALLEHHVPDGRVSCGFIVATESSMQPRYNWPMLLPLAVLELVSVDWIGACSVPKPPALASIDDVPVDGYLTGWLPGDVATQLPIVTIEAHLGHEFAAQYRQAKNHELRHFDELS